MQVMKSEIHKFCPLVCVKYIMQCVCVCVCVDVLPRVFGGNMNLLGVLLYKLACYPPTPRLALIILILWYSRILQFNYYYLPEILAIMLDH